MKKIIIASAVVLTTGALTMVSRENVVKPTRVIVSVIVVERSLTATAD